MPFSLHDYTAIVARRNLLAMRSLVGLPKMFFRCLQIRLDAPKRTVSLFFPYMD
jgi:hypothetical protein